LPPRRRGGRWGPPGAEHCHRNVVGDGTRIDNVDPQVKSRSYRSSSSLSIIVVAIACHRSSSSSSLSLAIDRHRSCRASQTITAFTPIAFHCRSSRGDGTRIDNVDPQVKSRRLSSEGIQSRNRPTMPGGGPWPSIRFGGPGTPPGGGSQTARRCPFLDPPEDPSADPENGVRAGSPRGDKKCTFSRVFNNSPSRDRSSANSLA